MLKVSPHCQNISAATPLVSRAAVCQGASTLQWSEGYPYSSSRQGLPAAAHASPWALTQVLPQELASPPVGRVSGIRLVMGMDWKRLTAGRVEVESTKVDGVDAKVHGEVQTLAVGEWVAAVRVGAQTESLCERKEKEGQKIFRSRLHHLMAAVNGERESLTIANANHVLRIKRLDIRAGRLNPVINDRRITALAARLISQLPRENGR